jgi:hypothetical protein
MPGSASKPGVEALGPATIHQAAWCGDRELVLKFVKEAEDMGYPATETLQQRDGVTGDTPLHKAVENNQEALVRVRGPRAPPAACAMAPHGYKEPSPESRTLRCLPLVLTDPGLALFAVAAGPGGDAQREGQPRGHSFACGGHQGALQDIGDPSRVRQDREEGEGAASAPGLRKPSLSMPLADACSSQVTDNNGDTAVHWAATKGHLDITELLLSHGAALDIANKQGWTALHRAAFNGRIEVRSFCLFPSLLLLGSR